MRDVPFTPYNPDKKKKKTGPSSLNQDASKSTPIGFEFRTFSLWGGRPTQLARPEEPVFSEEEPVYKFFAFNIQDKSVGKSKLTKTF